MAWYALWKWFIPWRKKPYINQIELYKEKLFNEWYESLTDEEKDLYNQKIADRKKKRQDAFKNLMLSSAIINATVNKLSS